MAKGRSAHLESLVNSVDQLLFAGFVVSYILDGNLLGLVIKCICKSDSEVVVLQDSLITNTVKWT